MKGSVMLIAVLVAGCLCFGNARLPSGLMPALSDETGWFRVDDYRDLSGLLTAVDRRGRDFNEGMFGVSIKYIVPPESLHDFSHEFKKLYKSSQDKSGIMHYKMQKTLNDNYMFILSAEYKSYEDWIDHVESSSVKDWVDFLADNQIIYFIRPLTKVTDDFMRSSGSNRRSKGERVGLIFRFHVDQKHHQDFVDAWNNVAKKTSREDGNEVYLLRKSMLSNTEFYAFGNWESWSDVWDHVESKHFDNLRDFSADKNIFWTMSPVKDFRDTWD